MKKAIKLLSVALAVGAAVYTFKKLQPKKS